MFTKAPPRPSFEQRWSVWAAGFGGSQTTDGNVAVGSNDTTSRLGAVAVGADGLVVEVHPCPEKAFSDGAQSLKLADFAQLMRDLQPYLRLWKEARALLAPAVA